MTSHFNEFNMYTCKFKAQGSIKLHVQVQLYVHVPVHTCMVCSFWATDTLNAQRQLRIKVNTVTASKHKNGVSGRLQR